MFVWLWHSEDYKGPATMDSEDYKGPAGDNVTAWFENTTWKTPTRAKAKAGSKDKGKGGLTIVRPPAGPPPSRTRAILKPRAKDTNAEKGTTKAAKAEKGTEGTTSKAVKSESPAPPKARPKAFKAAKDEEGTTAKAMKSKSPTPTKALCTATEAVPKAVLKRKKASSSQEFAESLRRRRYDEMIRMLQVVTHASSLQVDDAEDHDNEDDPPQEAYAPTPKQKHAPPPTAPTARQKMIASAMREAARREGHALYPRD